MLLRRYDTEYTVTLESGFEPARHGRVTFRPVTLDHSATRDFTPPKDSFARVLLQVKWQLDVLRGQQAEPRYLLAVLTTSRLLLLSDPLVVLSPILLPGSSVRTLAPPHPSPCPLSIG